MKTMTLTSHQQRFAEDVKVGLTADQKHLSSKYFYNKAGDELFVKIMHCEDYYPTRSELEILTQQSEAILESCSIENGEIEIVELGAGDGLKTRELLKAALKMGLKARYVPIDISSNAVHGLTSQLKEEIPELDVEGRVGDYFNVLDELKDSGRQKLILFLGSTIGNMQHEKATRFLSKVSSLMRNGDDLLIGFDLKKDPDIIRAAYDDRDGYTREFNMNLLRRINDELGGNIKLDQFIHYPVYNPLTGTAKSFIVSKVEQTIHVEALDMSFNFNAWEAIHTEISQKYDRDLIAKIAEPAGLESKQEFKDSKQYFADVLFKKKNT
ncbi:MAG: L-histidine N(alpha)-methyltransferase [Flavobacteriales bacterium]|nr:L-histidine N(alpha)-methyltransferase [Flavobacteriales bacterium]